MVSSQFTSVSYSFYLYDDYVTVNRAEGILEKSQLV